MWFAILAPFLICALVFSRGWLLRCFFGANLLQATVCFLALHWWPWDSWRYGIIYGIAVAVIDLACVPLVWTAVFRLRKGRWLLYALAVFLGLLCYHASVHDHASGWAEQINYANGAIDMFMGTCAVIGAGHLFRFSDQFWKVAFALGLLWLGQSLYEFGVGIHMLDAGWRELNLRVLNPTTAMLVLGCAVIPWLEHVRQQ